MGEARGELMRGDPTVVKAVVIDATSAREAKDEVEAEVEEEPRSPTERNDQHYFRGFTGLAVDPRC